MNSYRVRAIAITPKNKLLLIKRVKSNIAPYWVFIGGGVEKYDISFSEALERELIEEANASVEISSPVYQIKRQKEEGNEVEIYYIVDIKNWSQENRTGIEFKDKNNGLYIIEEIDLNKESLKKCNIKPFEVKKFILNNIDTIKNLEAIDLSLI